MGVVLIWHAYGLYSVNHTYFYSRIMGNDVPWAATLPVVLPGTWLWILLTPAVAWLARRILDRIEGWPTRLAVHLAVAVGVATLDAALDFLRARLFTVAEPQAFSVYLLYQLDHNVMLYAIIVSVVYAHSWQRTLKRREREAARLETELAHSELQVLKMQLQPHFLFNTLNSIAALVYRDPAAADRMVTRLSDLLRMSLLHGSRQEVPLHEEIELLRAYVEIQETRFRGRLVVTMEVEDAVASAQVPHLFLQPLVENAIKHGYREPPGEVSVRVVARSAGEGAVMLEVVDDGPGFPDEGAAPTGGIGLMNARTRLRQLYPGTHTFALGNRSGGGAFVRVRLPLRHGPAAVPALTSIPTPARVT